MKYFVEIDGSEIGLEVAHLHEGTVVTRLQGDAHELQVPVDFAAVHANDDTGEGLYSFLAGGRSFQLYVERTEHGYRVVAGKSRFELTVLTEREWRLKQAAPRQSSHPGEAIITAPMPGLIKAVLVSEGDTVKRGQRLLVLEAMKMENDITAPADGTVSRVDVQAGNVVESGKPLIKVVA